MMVTTKPLSAFPVAQIKIAQISGNAILHIGLKVAIVAFVLSLCRASLISMGHLICEGWHLSQVRRLEALASEKAKSSGTLGYENVDLDSCSLLRA